MNAEYKCTKCGAVINAPEKREEGAEHARHSGNGKLTLLPKNGEITIAVCVLGGSYLGLAAGPAGAIIGGTIGAVIGAHASKHD